MAKITNEQKFRTAEERVEAQVGEAAGGGERADGIRDGHADAPQPRKHIVRVRVVREDLR